MRAHQPSRPVASGEMQIREPGQRQAQNEDESGFIICRASTLFTSAYEN